MHKQLSRLTTTGVMAKRTEMSCAGGNMVFTFERRRTVAAMALFFLLAAVWFCPALMAQTAPVVSSYAVPLGNPGWQSTQFWKLVISSQGDVIAGDIQSNAIYQFPADGSAVKTIVGPAPDLFGSDQWQNGNLILDADDTLYITARWDGYILKIPYDKVEKTWHVVISDSTKWGYNGGPASVGGWVSPMDITYVANDTTGNGNFFISDENGKEIYQYSGTGNGTLVVGGLKLRAIKLAVDKAGNLYFIEDLSQGGAVGTFRIPAGTYGLMGTKNDGTMEAGWPKCGPDAFQKNGNTWKQLPCRVDNNIQTNATTSSMNGVALDADGNIYLSDEKDPFNTASDATDTMQGGIFKVPVEKFYDGDTLMGVMPNPAHQILIAPVPAQGSVAVDPKGNLYIPLWPASGTGGGWNGINNITKVFLGSAGLQASPLGQEGASSQVMYAFNSSVAPSGFSFSQGSQEAQDFAEVTGGTCATGTTYTANQRCTLNVALKPQVVGPTSGLLTMQAGGQAVAATFVHGEGQGPALAVLTPGAEVAIRAGLLSPKQVTTDRWGNFYVADAGNGTSGSGRVLMYARGATDSTQPTVVGTDFVAPTGVAVDGAGNVFVADNGNVIEVPISGAAQGVVKTGLGTNLRLTADGSGNVYVADPDNGRVVKVPNPDAAMLTGSGIVTVGSGFTAPPAVAADDAGNVFVVDGATLTEVLVSGGQTPLTNELMSPVGVALDASGSVYVAQADGVIRIPKVAGALDYTGKTAVGLDVTIPNSVAVDNTGVVYIADGETPGVVSVGANGAVDFGFVTMNSTATQFATLFNIGNQNLTVGSPLYASLGGAFSLSSTGDHCSGATVNPGATCSASFTMTPTGNVGPLQESGNIQSDAKNGNVLLTLLGVGSNSAPSRVAAITYAPTDPVYPGNVTVSVTVAPETGAGIPTGKVVLTVDNQPTKPVSLDENATAQFTLRRPNGGQHVVVATYQGDMNYASVSSTLDPPLVIGRASSTTVMTPPPAVSGVPGNFVLYQGGYNMQVKVSSTAGAPTGAVVFREGNTQLGTGSLDANGNVSFNTASLPLGTHTITAVYSGDTNFSGSSSASVDVQIISPSVAITTANPALTITPGTPAMATISAVPLVGFNNRSVQLACVNLPRYSECTFDTPTLDFSNGTTVVIQVTISTNVPVNVGALHVNGVQSPVIWWPASTFAVGLVGLVLGKKTKYNGRVLTVICAVLIIAGAMVGMMACSGNSYTKTPPAPHVVTPSGTQAVLITGSSNGQVVSLPFQLNVTVQ